MPSYTCSSPPIQLFSKEYTNSTLAREVCHSLLSALESLQPAPWPFCCSLPTAASWLLIITFRTLIGDCHKSSLEESHLQLASSGSAGQDSLRGFIGLSQRYPDLRQDLALFPSSCPCSITSSSKCLEIFKPESSRQTETIC